MFFVSVVFLVLRKREWYELTIFHGGGGMSDETKISFFFVVIPLVPNVVQVFFLFLPLPSEEEKMRKGTKQAGMTLLPLTQK